MEAVNASGLDSIRRLIPLLLPIIVLELGLMVAALWDIAHREKVRGGNKLVWVLVAIFINLLGPLAYFLFGRED